MLTDEGERVASACRAMSERLPRTWRHRSAPGTVEEYVLALATDRRFSNWGLFYGDVYGNPFSTGI